MSPNYILIFLGLLAILTELLLGAVTGFDLALLGTSLLIGGIAGNIFNNYQIGITTSIILIILYVFFGRKLIKNKLSTKNNKTNVDNLIGESGICTKPIEANSPGQVKIKSEIWRAESDEKIEKGDKIKVISIEGVTLNVTTTI